LEGITDGSGNAVFDPRPYAPPLPRGPSRVEQALGSAWAFHQRLHQGVRDSVSGGTASGYEGLAAFDVMGSGVFFGAAGSAAFAEGALLTGAGFFILGGELVWVGIDILQGLGDRHRDENERGESSQTCPNGG